METNRSDESSTDEPNSKRPKLESDSSTSSKPSNHDCPILNLPADILAKVIAFTPIAQWPALELLYDFREATINAWRQLRHVNVYREFLMKCENASDQSAACISTILQKLVERSPFLTSISGIDLYSMGARFNSDAVHSLAQFEHLQSLTLGDTKFVTDQLIPLAAVVEFLESTRSRASLKELRIYDVKQRQNARNTVLDRFASSFVNGREIQLPLLEKFSFSTPWPFFIRLDTMDTTRLTDLCLGGSSIEPEQLSNLIERASKLSRVEVPFLECIDSCDGQRLQANKKLLSTLASHENLSAIKFDYRGLDYCKCSDFKLEFIEMLKTIGRRGHLRKLALEDAFVRYCKIDMDDVCATVREFIPYLSSLKMRIDKINDGNADDIIKLTELRELHLSTCWSNDATTSAMRKIVQQCSRLNRLAINCIDDIDENSLNSLASSTTLMDLRFSNASCINADVFIKWSDGFASNLEILMLEGVAKKEDQNDEGLAQLLEKATRLRVLILEGYITDRSLIAIANSCPQLEIFGVRSSSDYVTVERLQEIVDRCPKLKRVGCWKWQRRQLQFPKYRKIADVDFEFWKHDFDDDEYNG